MATRIDDALAEVLAACAPLASEQVELEQALGRTLAGDARSELSLPPFANSAMDGFAVRAADTAAAPVTLVIRGEARAGAPFDGEVVAGSAVRIATGAPLPAGADAVVRVEETAIEDDGVLIGIAVTAGTDVRVAGDDIATGELVVPGGTPVGAGEIAMLAAIGSVEVTVHRRPRVAIVGTGDELVPPGEPLGPGQIHDSNVPMLAALCTEAGAEVVVRRPRIADSLQATRTALADGLQAADIVLVSGGVSVGPHDHVRPALTALGARERFWRLALRPGHPTWFGTVSGKPVLALPGNPASAFVIFNLLGLPALHALAGRSGRPREIIATYRGPEQRKRPGMAQVVRCSLRFGSATDPGEVLATPTGAHQRSNAVSSLVAADGLIVLSEDAGPLRDGDAAVVRMR